ncbi:integrase [Escherichia coli]|uniref:integrase n=1 Tax=Escherichia coli TaxID=562 RepID=UPI000BDF13D4|nr:integrase [Escherichia coli]
MHRIDTKTAQKDKFGAGKNGFTRGNPQTGTPATDLDDDYFDMLQEELCSVVEASGASLEKARHDQLLTALRALLLSRKNPFGDIKSDGTVKTALENLGLGAGAPAIGIPFFWPSSAMPNTVMTEWADMVFLKFNGATFSASTYPKLALVFPGLVLTESRGEFLRTWDDGRGVDSGRTLLSAQSFAIQNITGSLIDARFNKNQSATGAFTLTTGGPADGSSTGAGFASRVNFDASRVVNTATETRPRNIAFNFLVRAK